MARIIIKKLFLNIPINLVFINTNSNKYLMARSFIIIIAQEEQNDI